MPKMKSKSALTKRIKVTKSGKLMRKAAYTSHLAPPQNNKTKKTITKSAFSA